MAEFCTCGSIIIAGNCTNKNCANRSTGKAASPKSASTKSATKSASIKSAGSVKKEPKSASARTRRASKVVTYNLYDLPNTEENIE